MSTPPSQNHTHNVIDLTDDPPSPIFAPRSNVHPLNRRRSPAPRSRRGPRYERDIIDAEAAEETPTSTVDLRESSPEVQFIRARPRSQSTSSRTRGPPNHRVFSDPRLPSPPPERRHGRMVGVPGQPPILVPDYEPYMAGFEIFMTERRNTRDELVQIDDWPLGLENALGGFEPPDFNFGLQGFNLEHPSRPIVPPPRLPTYDAPPPARAGFTRDLNEDDVLICPNCDDELGVGEDDTKRQVWIVKSCGHVSNIHTFSIFIVAYNFPSSRSTVENVQRIGQSAQRRRTLHRGANHSRSAWLVTVGRLYQRPA